MKAAEYIDNFFKPQINKLNIQEGNKKFRNIVVDGVEYAWSVKPRGDKSDDDKHIIIWLNKKIIATKDISGYTQITPEIIEKIIKDQI